MKYPVKTKFPILVMANHYARYPYQVKADMAPIGHPVKIKPATLVIVCKINLLTNESCA